MGDSPPTHGHSDPPASCTTDDFPKTPLLTVGSQRTIIVATGEKLTHRATSYHGQEQRSNGGDIRGTQLPAVPRFYEEATERIAVTIVDDRGIESLKTVIFNR